MISLSSYKNSLLLTFNYHHNIIACKKNYTDCDKQAGINDSQTDQGDENGWQAHTSVRHGSIFLTRLTHVLAWSEVKNFLRHPIQPSVKCFYRDSIRSNRSQTLVPIIFHFRFLFLLRNSISHSLFSSSDFVVENKEYVLDLFSFFLFHRYC
jgi:hypothetical protein